MGGGGGTDKSGDTKFAGNSPMPPSYVWPRHQFGSESSRIPISSPALNDSSLSSAASKSKRARTLRSSVGACGRTIDVS